MSTAIIAEKSVNLESYLILQVKRDNFTLCFLILPPELPCLKYYLPIPVAARSKAWVYGSSLTGIVGSNPA
jgi:hypothetical protein